jgi:hypothetical protein
MTLSTKYPTFYWALIQVMQAISLSKGNILGRSKYTLDTEFLMRAAEWRA